MSPLLRITIPAVALALAGVGAVVAIASAGKISGSTSMEAALPPGTHALALTVGSNPQLLAEAAQSLGAVGSPIGQVRHQRCKVLGKEAESANSQWWLGPEGMNAGVALSHIVVRSTLRKSANAIETGYFYGKTEPASNTLKVMVLEADTDTAMARSLCEQVAPASYLATFSRELQSAGDSVVLKLNGQPITLLRHGDVGAQSKEYRAEVSEQVMAAAQALVDANPVWAHVHAEGDMRFSPLKGLIKADEHTSELNADAPFTHDDYEFQLADMTGFRLVLGTANKGGELRRTISVLRP